MPKRLGTLFLSADKGKLEQMCKEKDLNDYETEMDFTKFGKDQKFYSSRSINTFHKQAFLKLMK